MESVVYSTKGVYPNYFLQKELRPGKEYITKQNTDKKSLDQNDNDENRNYNSDKTSSKFTSYMVDSMLKPLEKSSALTEAAESRMRCSGKECLVAEPISSSDKTIENMEVLSSLHGNIKLNETAEPTKPGDSSGSDQQVLSVSAQGTPDQATVSTTSKPLSTTTSTMLLATKTPDKYEIPTTESTLPPTTVTSTTNFVSTTLPPSTTNYITSTSTLQPSTTQSSSTSMPPQSYPPSSTQPPPPSSQPSTTSLPPPPPPSLPPPPTSFPTLT